VAQGVDPEFKAQYCKKKKERTLVPAIEFNSTVKLYTNTKWDLALEHKNG
jgi:hypothetical protein